MEVVEDEKQKNEVTFLTDTPTPRRCQSIG